ncbi:hypothetical protein [Plantactinospora sp. B5E13]|uniref:hypothetical protein n=1 Tax=unclassified Plantactinospora TaxID=2631981 RepID=UPI00325EA19E
MSHASAVTRRLARWSYLLIVVVVAVGAAIGAVRLVVPATAGVTADPPGVRRQLTFLPFLGCGCRRFVVEEPVRG